VQLAKYLEGSRPELFAEPTVQLTLAAAHRRLGQVTEAQRYYRGLRRFPETNPWRVAAATEQWLDKSGELPADKSIAFCCGADHPPHLDGQFVEPFWQSAETINLSSPIDVKHPIVSVRFAYDERFLYIAVMCPKSRGTTYTADNAPRPRDADLGAHDRVLVEIDVDRDYTTSYELTIDYRGWTHDACWDDHSWNPSWFVAAASDERAWTAEAAIPLAELGHDLPSNRHAWAVSLRRIAPGVEVATWCGHGPAERTPDRFGLLRFE
jgi:hypothetical protein